jgi:hypothetical protein
MDQHSGWRKLLNVIQEDIRDTVQEPLRKAATQGHRLDLQNTPDHMRNTPAYRMAHPEREQKPQPTHPPVGSYSVREQEGIMSDEERDRDQEFDPEHDCPCEEPAHEPGMDAHNEWERTVKQQIWSETNWWR